jgi:hypothetical protein
MADEGWGIKLTGVDVLEAALRSAGDRAPDVLEIVLVQEMQLVMVDSKEIVPVGKTGNLKASGTILQPQRDGVGGVTLILGYGGAASVYAPIVHNMPFIRHPTKPGTKSHFLSDPLTAHLPSLESRLASRIGDLIS